MFRQCKYCEHWCSESTKERFCLLESRFCFPDGWGECMLLNLDGLTEQKARAVGYDDPGFITAPDFGCVEFKLRKE